ncbi:MAG: prepilin-type N-terminal cleavage/methylation domain-containing protein [Wenzhouxiangella sp.]|nr:MAG: prepilin-type N-terminal cleavage/methylation domain-containing protein [Wenzhouxiangella sp.]
MRHHARGLTIVELMITLAVAAILASVGVPAMGGFIAESRITTKSNVLMAHVQFARNAAITMRSNVVACPSADQQGCSGDNRWDQGWIVFIDRENQGAPSSPEDVLRVIAPETRLLLHSAGRTRVRFQPGGGAFGTNLTIRVCDPTGRASPRAVIVSNPGRARVSSAVNPSECLI